jgi:hypothetical protein
VIAAVDGEVGFEGAGLLEGHVGADGGVELRLDVSIGEEEEGEGLVRKVRRRRGEARGSDGCREARGPQKREELPAAGRVHESIIIFALAGKIKGTRMRSRDLESKSFTWSRLGDRSMTEFQGTRNKPANNGSRMERGFAVEPRPAPPAYRPNHGGLQPKMAAPLVYRPNYGGLQPKMVAPPVYRPTAGLPVQSKTISPRVFRPGTTPQVFRPVAHIQPYVPKKSERSAIVELRNRYVKANGDDYAHYAGTFDEYVDSADTMEQIVEFVVAAEKVAARKTVPKDPPPTVLQKPPQTPASSPAAKQQRAEKQKEKKRQKALDKQSRTIDLSIPAQPVPLQTQWKAVATASASLPAPTPSPASKPLSFVENLLAKVEKWDRKTDKGKTVSLSESQAPSCSMA